MILPNRDWRKEPPESQGVDSSGLNTALAYLDSNMGGCGAAETVVVRNGTMIWEGPQSDAYHQIFSCTKAFTTTVLGLLVGDGLCGLEDRAIDYRPDLADAHPAYREITLRHLATMTSGYDGDRGPENPELPWGDPNYYIRPVAPLYEPGTSVKYHDPNVHLLGYILTRIAKRPLDEIIRTRIADPIGMARFDWKALPGAPSVDGVPLINPAGSPYPVDGGGVRTTPGDFARYGHLYLNRGNWNGAQLLDASWADMATTTQVPASTPTQWLDLAGHYGFLWWTNGRQRDGSRPWPAAPPRTATPIGAGRNYCFVIPEWKMVVARMSPAEPIPDVPGRSRTGPILNGFLARLGEAIVDGGCMPG